ncbi:MAG TPA: Na/Pi cotransporter family protein [Deinococcales bacterium]|nr:Na/Pi cotransporter family protein [Deinococcales bacterium]
MLVALGGLGLFLFGLELLASNLRALAGPALNRFLRTAGRNPLTALLAGIGVTTVIQSGLGVGLMIGSFADAGLVALRPAMALVLGSFVGATVTVQLAAIGILGAALPAAGLGAILNLTGRVWARQAGTALIGLGLVLHGLKILVDALKPVAQTELFQDVLAALATAPFGVALIGLVLAALLHSSNAPAAVAIGLLASGAFPLETAVAFIAGAGSGTPILAYLESATLGVNARRIALAHAIVKVAGSLLVVAFLLPVTQGMAALSDAPARFAANTHSLFALAVGLLALPFLGLLEAAVRRLIPDQEDRSTRPKYLSESALEQPALAYALAVRELNRIADHVLKMISFTMDAMKRDRTALEKARREEEVIDSLVNAVVMYAGRLGDRVPASNAQGLITAASRLESIGDLLKRLLRQEEKLSARGLTLSPEGQREIDEIAASTFERARLVLTALSLSDVSACEQLAAERAHVREAIKESRAAHLTRLGRGVGDSPLTSSVHLDTLTILEQVNSAVADIGAEAGHLQARVLGLTPAPTAASPG